MQELSLQEPAPTKSSIHKSSTYKSSTYKSSSHNNLLSQMPALKFLSFFEAKEKGHLFRDALFTWWVV